MSAERQGPDRRLILVAAAVVVALAVLFAYLLTQRESAEDVVIAPSPTAPVTATPTETASPSETPSPTEAPSPSEMPSPTEATEPPTETAQPQPTDADLAAFAAAEGPAEKTAAGDITGDGVDEAVLAFIRNNAVSVVVGTWDGQAYQRTFRDDGGPAQRVSGLRVEDVNGRPGAEIVTEQAAGTQGRSISLWGRGSGGVQRQAGKGGCWDGSATYGIAGATVAEGRITATCDGTPEPESSWTSDIYEWRKGRWTYVTSTEPGQ